MPSGGGHVLTVQQERKDAGPRLVVTMHGAGMLPKGEERPQGDKGPAYIQEWSVRFDV